MRRGLCQLNLRRLPAGNQLTEAEHLSGTGAGVLADGGRGAAPGGQGNNSRGLHNPDCQRQPRNRVGSYALHVFRCK